MLSIKLGKEVRRHPRPSTVDLIQVQRLGIILVLRDAVVGKVLHVLPPASLGPGQVVHDWEEVRVHKGVDARERRVRHHVADGAHDALDVVAAVQEPEPPRVRDGPDDVERVALQPVPQVELDAALGHLGEPLPDQVRALVHVRLVRHQRGHAVRVLQEPPVRGVPPHVLVREHGPGARALPDGVPVGLGKGRCMSVDDLAGVQGREAVSVRAIAYDWT